jgi:hypothetical protein
MQPTTRNTIELHRKFVRLRKIIREWKGNRVGNLTTQKKTSNEILQWLDRTWESRQLTSLEKLTIELVIKRLEVSMRLEEELWRQRAKRAWIHQGNRNTTYFHAVASTQKRKNWIASLEHEDRQCMTHEDKAKLLHRYFPDLMGSTQNTSAIHFSYGNLYNDPLNNEDWLQL